MRQGIESMAVVNTLIKLLVPLKGGEFVENLSEYRCLLLEFNVHKDLVS